VVTACDEAKNAEMPSQNAKIFDICISFPAFLCDFSSHILPHPHYHFTTHTTTNHVSFTTALFLLHLSQPLHLPLIGWLIELGTRCHDVDDAGGRSWSPLSAALFGEVFCEPARSAW